MPLKFWRAQKVAGPAAFRLGHRRGERSEIGLSPTRHGVPSAVREKRLLAYPALTLAYVVTGKLALLLAAPPGYASPIFPPAGLAVAAMLIDGPATLPWVCLGSLLLNLWIGYADGVHLAASAVAAALGIAVASGLQAAIAGHSLKRAIGYPAALDNGRDVLLFLVLVPLCCLVSASLSVGALLGLGVVAAADVPANWISWWLGDTLGVLVVLPLLLVVAGEPRRLWRSRALPVALPMIVFFTLFAVIFVRIGSWERADSLVEFRLLSQQTADKIKSGLEDQSVFLQQLERSFTGRRTEVTRAGFAHLVQRLLEQFPMIQAVEWAPRIEAAARLEFERQQQAELPGFEIREADRSGQVRRAGERSRYYPVTYVEPLAGNAPAIGFDLASNSDRAAALAATEATGAVAATAPVRLVQETGHQSGLLLMLAVHGGANGPGVVLAVLRMETFVGDLLAPVKNALMMRLVDAGPSGVLFDTLSAAAPDSRFGQSFAFGGRHYRIETAPTPAYLLRHPHWQSWAVLVAGLFSTGLLGALLLLGTGYTRRVETVVDERTRELETANRRLAGEIRERQQAEAALRQAQRLEAVGQLTGGIAHDFNNLLTIVSGNAELLRAGAVGEAMARRAVAIERAAERGERLTRQLLAFSRRQTLHPETMDLRRRASEIAELLSRSLRDDIVLTIDLPEDVWPVAVDLAELELALLNIGVNARDAMPQGGNLHLAARNLPGPPPNISGEGEFVAMTLSDTGTGMTPEVLAHAFDPYYTTKPVGLGSGLGLSQVYGIAQQSGGAVTIASTPGEGTTVTLYLPRAMPTNEASAPREAPAAVTAPGLRILLVEDDNAVAEATAELLVETGWKVVRAATGDAALAVVERDTAFDLVLSDLIMPGETGGLELARILRQRCPGLPVLLATGYSRHGEAAVGEGFALIEKPYRREALLSAIHTAIAGRDSRA